MSPEAQARVEELEKAAERCEKKARAFRQRARQLREAEARPQVWTQGHDGAHPLKVEWK